MSVRTIHPWTVYNLFRVLDDRLQLLSRPERWTAGEAHVLVRQRKGIAAPPGDEEIVRQRAIHPEADPQPAAGSEDAPAPEPGTPELQAGKTAGGGRMQRAPAASAVAEKHTVAELEEKLAMLERENEALRNEISALKAKLREFKKSYPNTLVHEGWRRPPQLPPEECPEHEYECRSCGGRLEDTGWPGGFLQV